MSEKKRVAVSVTSIDPWGDFDHQNCILSVDNLEIHDIGKARAWEVTGEMACVGYERVPNYPDVDVGEFLMQAMRAASKNRADGGAFNIDPDLPFDEGSCTDLVEHMVDSFQLRRIAPDEQHGERFKFTDLGMSMIGMTCSIKSLALVMKMRTDVAVKDMSH